MNRRPFLRLSFLLLASCAGWGLGDIHAETWHVGAAREFTSLQQITKRLQPGDVVEVDPGDYRGMITFDQPGSAENPIVVRGLPHPDSGARPVLSGGGGAKSGSVVRFWGDHYRFENFEITAGGDRSLSRGLYSTADDVVIRDTLVRDIPANGIQSADRAGSLTLERVEVVRCGAGDRAHSIYAANDVVKYPGAVFTLLDSHIHRGTGGNLVKSRASFTRIERSLLEDSYYHVLDLIGADPDGQSAPLPAPLKQGAEIRDSRLVLSPGARGYLARIGSDGKGSSSGTYRFSGNTFVIPPGQNDARAYFKVQGDTGAELVMEDNEFRAYAATDGLELPARQTGELPDFEPQLLLVEPMVSGSDALPVAELTEAALDEAREKAERARRKATRWAQLVRGGVLSKIEGEDAALRACKLEAAYHLARRDHLLRKTKAEPPPAAADLETLRADAATAESDAKKSAIEAATINVTRLRRLVAAGVGSKAKLRAAEAELASLQQAPPAP